ncbi:hypothetical protein Tco_1120175 [Tanacetum coccineum]
MFDEYFNPPPIVVSPVQEADAPRAEVLADSPVSTSIDQDAPSQVFLHHKNMNILQSFLKSNLQIREGRPVIRFIKRTQLVLVIGKSLSRQHDKSKPVSYYLTD